MAIERAKWVAFLDELKLPHVDSQTNFIFFNADHPQTELASAFRAKGIEIGRTFQPYINWSRITIGQPEENLITQQQLRGILQDFPK